MLERALIESIPKRRKADRQLRCADLFCGGGGFTSGLMAVAKSLDIEVDLLAVNHWTVAIETHQLNHPGVRHLCQTIDTINPREVVPSGKLDILLASPECVHFSTARGGKPMSDQKRATPWCILKWLEQLDVTNVVIENVPEFCFPESTVVLSKRGMVPIGSLQLGDEVWTHNARWKPVTAIARRRSSTVSLKGYGNSIVETTPNHEFYAREIAPKITTSWKGARHESRLLEPEWVRADSLAGRNEETAYTHKHSGHAWATPIELPRYWKRMPKALGVDVESRAFFYMLGRWLGDGWIRKRKGKQSLVRICANLDEADDLQLKLAETGLVWYRSNHSASVDVFDLETAASRVLVRWINANFREYAHQKTLPAWVFAASEEQRWALIEGYMGADGHEHGDGEMHSTSVSRCLAVGFKLLLQSLGVAAHLSKSDARTAQWAGEREINCREAYTVSWRREVQWEKAFRGDLHIWGRVRECIPCRDDVEVVDITVADDHSFIADGQVVHNCTWGPLHPCRCGEEEKAREAGTEVSKVKHLAGFKCYRPIEKKKGTYFRNFLRNLRTLGYRVDFKVLNAADYGAATTRRRLFILARKGRKGIAWPEPTHYPPTKRIEEQGDLFADARLPWRAAREIIDWDIEGASIYRRKKPLAANTMARIEAGLKRFCGLPLIMPDGEVTDVRGTGLAEPFLVVLRNHAGAMSLDDPAPALCANGGHLALAEPYVVGITQSGSNGSCSYPIGRPLATITTKQEMALIEPYLVAVNHGPEDRSQSLRDPLPTLTGKGTQALIEPFLIGQQSGAVARSVNNPGPTIAAAGAISLVEPFLLPHQHGNDGLDNVRSLEEPLPCVTAGSSDMFLINPCLVNMKGKSDAASLDNPLPTITAHAQHLGVMEPFVVDFQGAGKQDEIRVRSVDDPLPTLPCSRRNGLAEPFLVPRYGEREGQEPRTHSLEDPMPTVVGTVQHSLAEPFLIRYHGTDQGAHSVDEPLPTITTRDRYALVHPEVVRSGKIDGQIVAALDIRFRMLRPHELAAAMSFPPGYKFAGTQGDAVKQVGNAVDVRMARALCGAVIAA